MTHLAILLALAAALASLWALWDARQDLRELGWADWAWLVGTTALGLVVSLTAFDALDNHAWRAHEEQFFAIYNGQVARGDYHPAEVQVLASWFYEQLGLRVGRSIGLFVGAAAVLGGTGPLLAGLAGRLATGRWIGGALPALLLALHPTLAYWRVHAYPIAPSQVGVAACLLAAVQVTRHGRRSAYTAWFLLGALTVFLRLDTGAAIACTAALPLLGGRAKDLLKVTLWLPGLVVAGALFALPELQLLHAMGEREDYRTGGRFLRLHGPVLARLGVGELGGGLALVAVALVGCVRPGQRRTAAACLIVAAVAAVLPLLFIDFGMRHVLAAATALYVAGGAGLAAIAEQRPRAASIIGLGVVVLLAVPWASQIEDLGSRYARVGNTPPSLPGVAPPSADPPDGWQDCAIYSNVQTICDASQNCHPVKDMRDPDLVRKRWDQFDGCVYWTVDAGFAEVAGVQHEWWPILRALYPSEAAGRVPIQGRGDDAGDAHMYRILRRP